MKMMKNDMTYKARMFYAQAAASQQHMSENPCHTDLGNLASLIQAYI